MRKIKQLEERIELLEKQVGKMDKFISNTIIPFMAEKETDEIMGVVTPALAKLFGIDETPKKKTTANKKESNVPHKKVGRPRKESK